MSKKLIFIIIIIFIVLAGLAGWYIKRVRRSAPNIPSLDRPITFFVDLSEESKQRAKEKIEKLSAELKQNPDLFDNWLELALYRKLIGDYEAARDIWEYCAVIRPKSSVPFNNLGNLYWHNLPDFEKAEKYFLKAIELQPDAIFAYRNLYELYLYSYKEKSHLFDDILLRGIEANPENPDLLVLLGGYYRDIGDKENARIYFERALKLVPDNKAIQQELQNL